MFDVGSSDNWFVSDNVWSFLLDDNWFVSDNNWFVMSDNEGTLLVEVVANFSVVWQVA